MAITLVLGDSSTSAGTNKVESWHRTLARTKTLQGTKNMNSLVVRTSTMCLLGEGRVICSGTYSHWPRPARGGELWKCLDCVSGCASVWYCAATCTSVVSNLDMAARLYNFRKTHAEYAPAETTVSVSMVTADVPSTLLGSPQEVVHHRHKRRKTAGSTLLHMYNDLFLLLQTRNRSNEATRLLSQEYPPVSLHGLLERGFVVRIRPAKELTLNERQTIEGALQLLTEENGAAAMGNYTNIASWIASTHLHNSRTTQRVAKYLAGLVVTMHRAAQERSQSVPALPDNIVGLTQLVENSGYDNEPNEDSDTVSCSTTSDDTHASDSSTETSE